MNKLILFLLLVALSGTTNAQIDQLKQDTLNQDTSAQDPVMLQELKMTTYDKDTSASAVILSDIGSVFILPYGIGFRNLYEHTLRIKILSQAGLSAATFKLPLLYHSFRSWGENITYFKAITYNFENGKIVSTAFLMKDMYEEKYPAIAIEKIAMPDVKVGSVINICYVTVSPFIDYINWDFQHDFPTVVSVFNLTIPVPFHYALIGQNIDTTKMTSIVRIDYSHSAFREYENTHTFAFKNIPALKDEPFMPSKEDCIIRMDFQLSRVHENGYGGLYDRGPLTTWKDFTHLLLYNDWFGTYLNSKEGYLGKVIEKLHLDGKAQAEKIKTIVSYVKLNYTWNNSYNYFTDKKLGDFIREKSGNSADINLFLIALFRAANINAEPVLLSTRSHGKIKGNYPIVSFFNDVACYIKTDSMALALDATEPLLPYYALPPQCINGVGYIVKEDDSEFVDLKSPLYAQKWESMLIKIPQNGDSINCTFTIKGLDYEGFELRKQWDEGYDKITSFLTKNKDMEIKDSIKAYQLHNPQEPFVISYSANIPLVKEKNDSNATRYQVIFSPFLKEPVQNNPFKTSDRMYPIDFNYPQDFKYQSFIMIPQGYKIVQIPAEASYSIPDNRATYSYKIKHISDSVIQFTSNLSFNVAIYQPSEYKDLKSIYDLAIKKCKEPIILQKE